MSEADELGLAAPKKENGDEKKEENKEEGKLEEKKVETKPKKPSCIPVPELGITCGKPSEKKL